MERMEQDKGIIGFAWYKPEQWARLRNVSQDADQLETDFESWRRNAQDKMLQLQVAGRHVERVEIDVEALIAWCAKTNKKINAQSRAGFAAHLLRERHEPPNQAL